MTRKNCFLLFLLIIISLVFVTAGFCDSRCAHVNLDWISSHIPLPANAKILQVHEKEELCEVVLAINGKAAPIYAGRDFILAGQLFKNGRSITGDTMKAIAEQVEKEKMAFAQNKALAEKERKVFLKNNIKAMDDLVSFSFDFVDPDKSRGHFYVVTDPDCSHCKDLLPKLESTALESGMVIKVILYPILGDHARNLAMQAICNNYSYAEYVGIEMNDSVSSCERSENLLAKTADFFQKANLSFVPLVVAGDGSWVVESNFHTMVRVHLGLESQGEGKETIIIQP